ncbi:DEAD/DEAH box helicase family protein [Carboxydocella sp. JDF658]|uniref:DEAD/DEAH box helicase family protein n=1 Tax=Carboxydocella sp. JDF658 TaxID=1926600 RepID=UPI0009AC79C6|nr:DEAD/DEAH box helicase family protein [Carboxydocella sp. JDF658]GAW32692.1 hypothetical protein JDF658_24570 [Carboxydocella sp. JDF658]
MAFRDLNIREGYDSSDIDVLNEFYIPVLLDTVRYDRLAGFFSSTALALAARGIAGLIKNNGKMRLVVSPKLSYEDVETIKKALNEPEFYLTKLLSEDIERIEYELERDHFDTFGWMIAKEKLEIKIAVILDDENKILTAEDIEKQGIFHQKVGILQDINGDILTFSGSINETAYAWIKNIEEFKVYRHWLDDERKYAIIDINKFESYWNNTRNKVKIYELPIAIKNHWIEKTQRYRGDLYLVKEYIENKNYNTKTMVQLNFFDYQKDAIQKWINNGYLGMLEMATGTGKTRTAIGCILEVLKIEKQIAIIIACPQNTLSLQWKNEIERLQIQFDKQIIADGTNKKWKDQLVDSLIDLSQGLIKNLIIFTTHATVSSNDFISIVKRYKNRSKMLFIGDEAHGLGAIKTRNSLIDEYDFRLGLSATPRRWYDEIGTKFLYKYFNDVVYEFSIEQALTTINPETGRTYLTNYYYYPVIVNLEESELEDYYNKTKKLIKYINGKYDQIDIEKSFENLLFIRSNIIKNASRKLYALEQILYELTEIDNAIIFTSPEQIDQVMTILAKKGIKAHKFTEKEGTIKQEKYNGLSEREYILENFKKKNLQVLAAIKCLDEGIDIPSAHTAIIMSSSGNPREYIQRIGRVIRQSPEKKTARIYDFIVVPNQKKHEDDKFREIELKILNKELIRAKEIAKNALNNAEALYKLNQLYGGKFE